MIYVTYETVISRPREEVFEQLVDIDRYPDWLPQSRVFLDCWQTSQGPVGEGTTFVDKTRAGIYRGVVTDFQRPVQVAFRMRLRWLGQDVMESRPRYRLEPVEGGTRVKHEAEGELYGLFRVLEPYFARRAEEERKRTVDVLKRTLESPGP